MNKRKKIDIYPYIQTILWAIFLACLFSGGVIYYAQYDVINNSYSRYNDKALMEYIRNTVIIQNEDLEFNHPDDYRIDIHLGYLHSVVKEYDKAEEYYLKAVQKAPDGIYRPVYELASFYIERGRYDEARNILETFPQVPQTPVIKYQSYLYRKLGDAFYKQGLYGYALNEYENSLSYWKKLRRPEPKYMREVNNNIYNTANKLADLCINNDKVGEGITYLNMAEKAKPKDFNIQYKLALATAETDPERSYKYFKKLFKEDPTRVDYISYYNLIQSLIYQYESEGDDINAKLYRFRAQHLMEEVEKSLIYPRDVDFRITNISLYKFGNQSKILIKYNLQNISQNTIKQLTMEVVYKLNGKKFETYRENLIENGNYLFAGNSIKDGTIVPKTHRRYKKSDYSKISAEIYLYKYPDKKICIFNDYLFDKDTKIKQSKQGLDCDAYIRFFASQILNFGSTLKTYQNSQKNSK